MGDLEQRLNTFILRIILPTSMIAAIANGAAISSGPPRYIVGAIGSGTVALLAALELANNRRAAVPAAVGIVTVVAVWIVTPDEATRSWIDSQLLFGPLLVGVLAPRWWKVTAPAVTVTLFSLAAVEVALGRSSVSEAFIRLGVLAVVSSGLIVIMALIDSARRQALAERSALIDASGAAMIHISYEHVLKRFHELRTRGVVDLDDHLGNDPEEFHHLIRLIHVRSFNRASLRLYGLAVGEDLTNDGVLPIEVRDMIRRELVEAWTGGVGLEHVYQVRRPGESTRWLRQTWNVATVEDAPDFHNVVVTTLDITDVKAAEAALAAEIRAKDDFIASVSHELRTPLAAVVGLASELRDRGDGFEIDEVRELIKLIADQSVEVSHIVEDLLVGARIDSENLSVTPTEFDVRDLIESIDGTVTLRARPGMLAWADPSRVRQILRNLFMNAERYGGSERIVRVFRDGTRIVIEVRDDGEGVPGSFRDKMFEPYETYRSTSGITASVGLGLTVSRSLAELMGATLEYDRIDGETVFTLVLPTIS